MQCKVPVATFPLAPPFNGPVYHHTNCKCR